MEQLFLTILNRAVTAGWLVLLVMVLRVVLNSALGLGVLWLLNSTAPVTGLTLGVNWFNALTVGVLGLPGLGLLLLVKWVLV